MRTLTLSIMLGLPIGLAAMTVSVNPTLKAPEVIAFIGLRKGDKVS